MFSSSFSPWPCYTEEEAEAAARIILSNKVNYWTGSECRHFEEEFAAWSGSKHAVALANGTVALDLALKILDIKKGDEIIVTPRTYIASVSSIVNAGAIPVFADVDKDSQNITVDTIKAVYTPKCKAIICVHLAGWPCEMDEIIEFANTAGLKIIEDCAQAHGARYKGRSVGSIGDVGAWSFCQDKIITTAGEGGMLTTNNTMLWQKAWSYKDHGKSWDAIYNQKQKHGFKWVHESFGTNWRMTEIQAAIGRIQIKRLKEWHEKRLDNANAILSCAAQLSCLRTPTIPAHIEHAFYKAYTFIRPDKIKKEWSRDKIIAEINQRGIPCSQGICPEVYLEKAFINSTYAPKSRLPKAKDLSETSLMFLVHPTLTETEVEMTSSVLKEVLLSASF